MRRLRQLTIFDEILVDSFAGGGGASTGIEMALGRSVDIAINHDGAALAMHEANHPLTRHFQEDVWEVDPVEACGGKKVKLAWFSPDCTHFSNAKGGKPRDQKIRALAWVSARWAKTVRPEVIILENVPEFRKWGPLLKGGKPCKKREGKTFDSFINFYRKLGYQVEFRVLKACDFGAPTSRKRLFMIARCDGRPIVWPEPTHGKPASPAVIAGKLKPWRTAAEIIDWSLPMESIFDRKKPLAEATLKRIAAGVKKFILEAQEPFIVTGNHAGEGFRGQDVNEPFKTVTASRDDDRLITARLMHYRDTPEGQHRFPDLDEPVPTVTGGGVTQSLVTAELIQVGWGERPGQAPRVPGINNPVGVVPAQGIKHALAVYQLVKNYGGNYKEKGGSANKPLPTVTAKDHNCLVSVFLDRQFGTASGAPVNEPVGTVMPDGSGKTALVEAFLLKYYGNGGVADMADSLPTVTGRDRFALVTINKVDYVIVDICMRMLQPHELFAAQGFPSDYIIQPNYKGKPLSKTAQIRLVGNSVCPPVACALVKANVQISKAVERGTTGRRRKA